MGFQFKYVDGQGNGPFVSQTFKKREEAEAARREYSYYGDGDVFEVDDDGVPVQVVATQETASVEAPVEPVTVVSDAQSQTTYNPEVAQPISTPLFDQQQQAQPTVFTPQQ